MTNFQNMNGQADDGKDYSALIENQVTCVHAAKTVFKRFGASFGIVRKRLARREALLHNVAHGPDCL